MWAGGGAAAVTEEVADGTAVGMAYEDTVLDADMAARTDAAVAVATGGASALASDAGGGAKNGDDLDLPSGDKGFILKCWAAEWDA